MKAESAWNHVIVNEKKCETQTLMNVVASKRPTLKAATVCPVFLHLDIFWYHKEI